MAFTSAEKVFPEGKTEGCGRWVTRICACCLVEMWLVRRQPSFFFGPLGKGIPVTFKSKRTAYRIAKEIAESVPSKHSVKVVKEEVS